jgi:hypothetical protein
MSMLSATSEAQDVATILDVRCMIVGMKISAAQNTTQQSQGILLSWYYIGRLDGRVPKLDMKQLVIQETGKMTTSDYASEARRCGAELAERGRQVMQLGTVPAKATPNH